jgi:sterol desaturase/sphingolipid hydroxylase (fatty acid hydroxylase superfamily)
LKIEYFLILLIFVGFALAEAVSTGFLRKPGQRRKDAIVEAVSSFILIGFTQPFILLAAGMLTATLLPNSQNALSGLPILAQVGLLLVFDDLTQYWWHRASHNVKWLYDLHRPHHDAEYMSIRIVYRNNLFYYLLMPGIWFSGALIYLGLGPVYAVYIVVKLLVICGAHSDVRWDAPLYRIAWLSPVMWIVERTISTPATHSAHHGRHASDGVTNYKGNYGNLLFFWDVLFGTAKITRRYPEQIGVENLEPVSAAHQLLWPLVRDRKAKRELLMDSTG